MTLTRPPVPGFLLDFLAGHWPEGDEDAMRRLAEHWSTMADSLQGLQQPAESTMNEALSAIDGRIHDAMTTYWQEIGGGDASELAKLVTICDSFSRQLEHGATDVEFAKLTIWMSLAAMVAMAFIPGVGEAIDLAAAAAVKLLIRKTILELIDKLALKGATFLAERVGLEVAAKLGTEAASNLTLSVAKNAVIGAGFGSTVDLSAQRAQVLMGHREQIDWGQVGTSAGAGALAGGVAGPIAEHVVAPAIGQKLDGLTTSISDRIGTALGDKAAGVTTAAVGLTGQGIAQIPGNLVGNAAASTTLAAATGQPIEFTHVADGAGGGFLAKPHGGTPGADLTPVAESHAAPTLPAHAPVETVTPSPAAHQPDPATLAASAAPIAPPDHGTTPTPQPHSGTDPHLTPDFKSPAADPSPAATPSPSPTAGPAAPAAPAVPAGPAAPAGPAITGGPATPAAPISTMPPAASHPTAGTPHPATTSAPDRTPSPPSADRPAPAHPEPSPVRGYGPALPEPGHLADRYWPQLPVADKPYFANPDYHDPAVAHEYAQHHPATAEARDIRARNASDHPELARLSDPELDLIRRNQYMTLNEPLNRAARDGETALLAQHDLEMRALVNAYNKLPDHEGVVFRSLRIDDPVELARFLDYYNPERPGPLTFDPGFASSDKVSSMAGGNIELVIKSRSGKDISWASLNQDEVVFPPGTKFFVKSRSFEPGPNPYMDKYVINLIDLGRSHDAYQSGGNAADRFGEARPDSQADQQQPRVSEGSRGDGSSQSGTERPGPPRTDRGTTEDLASLGRGGTAEDRTGDQRAHGVTPPPDHVAPPPMPDRVVPPPVPDHVVPHSQNRAPAPDQPTRPHTTEPAPEPPDAPWLRYRAPESTPPQPIPPPTPRPEQLPPHHNAPDQPRLEPAPPHHNASDQPNPEPAPPHRNAPDQPNRETVPPHCDAPDQSRPEPAPQHHNAADQRHPAPDHAPQQHDPRTPHPLESLAPSFPRESLTHAAKVRSWREWSRTQPPESGTGTPVRPEHSPTSPPTFDFARHPLDPTSHAAVVRIKVTITHDGTVAPDHLVKAWEKAQLAADLTFNRGQKLLSGDTLVVDLAHTPDPTTANLTIHITDTPGPWHPDAPIEAAARELRTHLGLDPSQHAAPLTHPELRLLSDDIAAANTPARFRGLEGTRQIRDQYLNHLEDPAFQHAVRDALREGNGFLVGADPRTNPYGLLINDHGPHNPGRSNNCLDNALAALSSFYADPQVALPRWPDELPGGAIDNESGEAGGLERAANFLGGKWQAFDQSSPSVPGQFSDLHEYIKDLGPGSSALVVNSWHERGGDGQLRYEADGSPKIEGTHATVIVFPHGAKEPVWWDPQAATMTDHPPQKLVDDSAGMYFMAVPSLAGGVHAGDPYSGTGGAVPGSDIPRPLGMDDARVPARLGLPDETHRGREGGGQGLGSDRAGDRFTNRDGLQLPELVPVDGGRGLHPQQGDGSLAEGRPDLPAPGANHRPPHAGDPGHDPVPDPDRLPDRSSLSDNGTRPHHQQDDPRLPANRLDLHQDHVPSDPPPHPDRPVAGTDDVRAVAPDSEYSSEAVLDATDRPSHGTEPRPLPNYQGDFRRDALDVMSALDNAGRPDVGPRFADLVNREVAGGNVQGLEEWMSETVPRARAGDLDQVLDKAAELTELDRLSREIAKDPDLHVRFNPGVSSGKSFDILVERTTNGAVTIERRVEIARLKVLPDVSTRLNGAALHGADKIIAPTPGRIPSAESTVVMPTPPAGGYTAPLGGGNGRRFGANGLDYEIVDPTGKARAFGNLLAELARSFDKDPNMHPGLPDLDAVNIVDDSGNLLGRITRDANGWK